MANDQSHEILGQHKNTILYHYIPAGTGKIKYKDWQCHVGILLTLIYILLEEMQSDIAILENRQFVMKLIRYLPYDPAMERNENTGLPANVNRSFIPNSHKQESTHTNE